MSFQENRFPIILGAGTAVVVGALAYWGISSSGKYGAAKDDYDAAAAEISRLTRGDAYPDAANVSAKEKAVSEYRAGVDEMQKTFDKYRATKLENVGVDDFGDALRVARRELAEKFEASETEMPADAHLGLGVYTRETVNAKNTGVLLYQLKAFEYLFDSLAKARITKLTNIYRPQLPEERGSEVDLQGRSYREHPIEISFVGRESSLRDFLSALDDSEEYSYVVRSLRVRSSKQVPPNARDAKFEQPKEETEAANPFGAGGFAFPEDEEEPAAEEETAEVVEEEADTSSQDSSQILKQVLGDEMVEVFVRIDVIQFLDPKPLPQG